MGCRIFVCDDAAGYRALVRAVLQPLGATIVGEAADVQACIDSIAGTDPDLVLLDVQMPGRVDLTRFPS
jgi:CheY-like chemotaxis protein